MAPLVTDRIRDGPSRGRRMIARWLMPYRRNGHPRLGTRRDARVVRPGARTVVPVPGLRLLDVDRRLLHDDRRRRIAPPVRPDEEQGRRADEDAAVMEAAVVMMTPAGVPMAAAATGQARTRQGDHQHEGEDDS